MPLLRLRLLLLETKSAKKYLLLSARLKMLPFSFNWSLDAGQILNIVTIIAGAIYFVGTLRAQFVAASNRLESVELEVKKLSEVVISNARLDERVSALSLRTTALEARSALGH